MDAIDLFAGAGGATAGLKAAGFNVLAAVEIDPDAAKTYRLNHPRTKLLERDIREVMPAKLRRAARLRKGELTLLQACPPCQTWSSLGKGAQDDPRNELLSLLADFIRGLKPSAFVIENVPGLRSDKRLGELIVATAKMGYAARIYLVDASSFSVPQRRKRLIVLGVLGADDEHLPPTLQELLPQGFDQQPRTVQDAIGHLLVSAVEDPLHRWRKLGKLAQQRVDALQAGGRRFDLPPALQLACHKSLKARNATSAYGRMAANDVSPTLTTRCTTPSCGTFIHPSQNRGLSLREAALLQTFPADYQFAGTYGSIERQIGNAIPVRLAQAAASAAATVLAQLQRA